MNIKTCLKFKDTLYAVLNSIFSVLETRPKIFQDDELYIYIYKMIVSDNFEQIIDIDIKMKFWFIQCKVKMVIF